MALKTKEVPTVSVDSVKRGAVDFTDELDASETLTGTPTVTQVSGAGTLSITSKAVNTAAIVVNGRTVAIGKAVQFLVSGYTAGETYVLKVSCATTASPAQTLVISPRFRTE